MTTSSAAEHRRAERAQWWRSAVVYQIYPRSFADSNGDGIGDLPGITSRASYLADLGVDAVWLCPFYPSALADGGYDVDDYRDVDPRLGTLADFDDLVAALHAVGVRIIVDLVPNHTSNRHPWFVEALASERGSAARDRYLFFDGLGPDGTEPPNDWQSGFGGPAWERTEDGQFYFHHFAREQPDLNWDNPQVREDFLRTVRFWCDRGVDGFRVDVAHGLVKDLSTPFRPWADLVGMPPPDGSHPLWDRDGVHEIYAAWRAVFDSYTPPRFAVAEAAVHPSRRARYADDTSLGQAFNFEMQEANFDAADFRRVIESGLADMTTSGAATTWLLGCHDSPRVASRYGLPVAPEEKSQLVARQWLTTDGRHPSLDAKLGLHRARAAALLLFALPGSTYVYQGDELGLPEVADLPAEVLTDPMATRSGGVEKGRDGCRVPLPWTREGTSYGVGSGPAHLPQPASFADLSVEAQEDDPASTLALYRQAIRLRHALAAGDDLTWLDSPDDVLAFRRPAAGARQWICVTNFGSAPVALPPGDIVASSEHLLSRGGVVDLPGAATAWIVSAISTGH